MIEQLSVRGGTVNTFRKRRGRLLAEQIRALSGKLGRPLQILDVGGRRDYWDNVGFNGIARVTLLNIDPSELGRKTSREDLFVDQIGDARNLANFADGSVDLYHSNSVIEHVGSWSDMKNMAEEARRVAISGWVQTPAWEFPMEPHFRLPFIHWLATPARTSLLAIAPNYGGQDRHNRRLHAERINLLSKGEMRLLFPGCEIFIERILLAKSYTARW